MLALARGLLYVAVIPPWQAPDEPWHFEYARLIADKGRLVTARDLSVPLQQAIIKSMIRFRFEGFKKTRSVTTCNSFSPLGGCHSWMGRIWPL